MDENVVDFIRDRFNSLETSISDGFKEVNTRLTTLEEEKIKKDTKQTVYSIVGGSIVTFIGWIILLISGK